MTKKTLNPEIEQAHYRLAQNVLAAKIGAKAAASRGSKTDFSGSIKESEVAVEKLSALQDAPDDVAAHDAEYLDAEEMRLSVIMDRLQTEHDNPELASILYPQATKRIENEDLVLREIALVQARLDAIAAIRKEIS